ncbi:MAG: lytic transglycosylase domain-containing protein [Methylococcaceae bacterium]|nr:lytic transglycosylase domain-containing protein [Methylococcaceae bacterium]
MLEFIALAQQCAPTVAPQTMAAIVNVESSYNPYAIGVVKGRLQRQPKNIQEAVATAKALAAAGWNFSIGIAQVNRYNLPKYNLTYEQGFEPCSNLWAGSKILEGCFIRADNNQRTQQEALKAAISCYYSNNFTRGFKPDVRGKPSYVEKVVASAEEPIRVIPVVPAIQTTKTKPQLKPEPPTTEPPIQLKKLPSTEGSQDELQQENTKQDDVVVF